MAEILKWIEKIQEVPESRLKALESSDLSSVHGNFTRIFEDTQESPGIYQDALIHASETQAGFYVVPKVIE